MRQYFIRRDVQERQEHLALWILFDFRKSAAFCKARSLQLSVIVNENERGIVEYWQAKAVVCGGKSVPTPLYTTQICPDPALYNTNLSRPRFIQHKPVPAPLYTTQICPGPDLYNTNLSRPRFIQHKPVPALLYTTQTCPGPALYNTNLSRSRFIKHKPVPAPLYTTQISHKLSWNGNRVSVVRGQRLPELWHGLFGGLY